MISLLAVIIPRIFDSDFLNHAQLTFMKARIPILLLLIGFSAYLFLKQNSAHSAYPQPTETIIKEGEEGDNQNKRAEWFELMHQAEEGTSWQAIEYQNQMTRHRLRSNSGLSRTDCELEGVANGQLLGTWSERGSYNQAGSMFDIAYDQEADQIWAISAGGSIFKSDRFGLSWQVVHQDIQFNHGILEFIPMDTGRRMIAFANRIPHYSDDDGVTWTAASGINPVDNWGTFHDPVIVETEEGERHIYVMAKPDYWTAFTMYRSVDNGETYQALFGLSTHDQNSLVMLKPHHSNLIYLVEKEGGAMAQIYLLDQEAATLNTVNEPSMLSFGNARANLAAWSDEETTRFFTYIAEEVDEETQYKVLESNDLGLTWTEKGILPARPWSVGIYTLPSNPDVLMMGEVECFRSTDAGETWELVNAWWEYYDNVDTKIHADIMHFAEFVPPFGDPFLLVSNHGGITYTTDNMVNQINIATTDLNVSQYYDVRTDPLDHNYVYAGSQDQGFQRASGFETGDSAPEFFVQVISGDYGHIEFSNNGSALWTVYPGGWVTYYEEPHSGGITASYDMVSENESVWLPPLLASPNPEEDAIYMAGGNIDGGAGSHLVKLTHENGVITPSQSTLDFRAEAGGEVSAIGSTPLNPQKMYLATTNGRFFYSTDGGENWDQTAIFLPGGHYLYGQAILGSKVDEDIVYLGGSGYSNPAVYKSIDGGATFVSMNEGLPSTLVFGLASNADESLIFAATEAGPYVYITEQEQWYDMAGFCAPAQTYWSVEYIKDNNTVRFGTYGRGIWDFAIQDLVNTNQPIVQAGELKVFPNPGAGAFSWRLSKVNTAQVNVQVFDGSGKQLYSQEIDALEGEALEARLDLQNYAKGAYYLLIRAGKQQFTEKLIIQ